MYFLLINGWMVIASVLVAASVNTQHHRPEEYWAFTKEIYSDWRGERRRRGYFDQSNDVLVRAKLTSPGVHYIASDQSARINSSDWNKNIHQTEPGWTIFQTETGLSIIMIEMISKQILTIFTRDNIIYLDPSH